LYNQQCLIKCTQSRRRELQIALLQDSNNKDTDRGRSSNCTHYKPPPDTSLSFRAPSVPLFAHDCRLFIVSMLSCQQSRIHRERTVWSGQPAQNSPAARNTTDSDGIIVPEVHGPIFTQLCFPTFLFL